MNNHFNKTEGPTVTTWRLGYYHLIGQPSVREIPNFWPSAPGNAEYWVSPATIDDDPRLPAMSDIMESGTQFRIGGGGYDPFSSYTHGPRGYVEVDGVVRMEDTAAQGGNVAYNDGHVEFHATSEMSRYYAHIPANVVAYWVDASEVYGPKP